MEVPNEVDTWVHVVADDGDEVDRDGDEEEEEVQTVIDKKAALQAHTFCHRLVQS